MQFQIRVRCSFPPFVLREQQGVVSLGEDLPTTKNEKKNDDRPNETIWLEDDRQFFSYRLRSSYGIYRVPYSTGYTCSYMLFALGNGHCRNYVRARFHGLKYCNTSGIWPRWADRGECGVRSFLLFVLRTYICKETNERSNTTTQIHTDRRFMTGKAKT